jgi:hypothetical protein
MKTRKQKGGAHIWLALKSIILGLSAIYTENNYILVSLMTFMNSLFRDKYNFFDDTLAVGYMFLFAYGVYNNKSAQPLYINPLTIKLKQLMIEPSIQKHASKLYASVVLLGVDILFLHETSQDNVLTVLLDVFIHGLTEMNLSLKGNTSLMYSNESVQSRAEAAWISMRSRYLEVLGTYDKRRAYTVVLGNIATILFTPEMPPMLRTLFVQTNWQWTKKYFVGENIGDALASLRWIHHALTTETSIRADKLHPFLREIIKDDFVVLPDFGPAIDIPFMLWLFLQNILSTPLRAERFVHKLTQHRIDAGEFETLLKHVNTVYAKLYITEISIMNVVCRSPITFLHENGAKLMNYFRARGVRGGGPLDPTLGKAFTNVSKIADIYSAEVHVNVDLVLNALNIFLSGRQFPKESIETMKEFHKEIVMFTPDKEVEDITEKTTKELDKAAAEAPVIYEGESYYNPMGGKTKRKRKKHKQKGGDFGVIALTTTLISAYGLTANSFPAFYNILSFVSSVKGNENVFESTGNLISAIVTGLYRYYNERSFSSFVRSNDVTSAVTGISMPNIKSDFIDFYKYGLLLFIDAIFLHEKKEETIYSDMVMVDGVCKVEGPNLFDSRNNLIGPLLDIWIFLLENVKDGLGGITETNTEYSVESRAESTWVQALAMYQRLLRQVDTDKNYGIVFDFLKLILFTNKPPEIVKRMLEKSIFYFRNGLINITLKDLNGNVILSTSVANYNKNILYLKNIRTLLVSNTTVRLDHLYFMLRSILEEEDVLDFPSIDGALSFNYISWLMFQNILGKPATLIKLIQDPRRMALGHVNKAEAIELFNNVSGLYYGLYVTSWTEFGVNSTYQAAVKATTAVRSLPARIKSMFWGGEGEEGEEDEEFFDPENIDEQRGRFIQESLSIIMAKIEFMNIIHTTQTGEDVTSGINEYRPQITNLVLEFSSRVESQEEPINDITEDILEKLELINRRI